MFVRNGNQRLTLIVSRSLRPEWRRSRVALIDSLSLVEMAVEQYDVERIIVDRCASADEFLHLLATLPSQLAGDVLLVRQDGAGFLSATGRGGDRVLYALAPHDVAFYIETHDLSAGTPVLALTA